MKKVDNRYIELISTMIKVMQIILGILLGGSIIGICGAIVIRINPQLIPFVKGTVELVKYLTTIVFPSLISLIIFSVMILWGLELLRKIILELRKEKISPVVVMDLLKKLLIGEFIYGSLRVILEFIPFDIEDNLLSILPTGGNYIELIIAMIVTYIAYLVTKRLSGQQFDQ